MYIRIIDLNGIQENEKMVHEGKRMTELKPCPLCKEYFLGSGADKTLTHPDNGCILGGYRFSDICTCKECGKTFPSIRHDPDTILGNFRNSVERLLCEECAARFYRERFGKGILDIISSDT